MPKLRFPDKSKADPDEDTDATNNARDKFKGELRKLYESDNSSASDDEPWKATDSNKKTKERVSRRTKARVSHVKDPYMHSFVMKLFDRSVDLTQFKPDTPLYPICREWFRNNPRSNNKNNERKDVHKKREDKRVSERDIFRLPSPLPFCEEYVPSPAPPPIVTDDFDLEHDPLVPLKSKEELLTPHIGHWVQVRARMRRAAHKKEQRYERSLSLIRGMCCRM